MDSMDVLLDLLAVAIVMSIYLIVFYITKDDEKANDMVLGALNPIITTIISAIILNYAKIIFK